MIYSPKNPIKKSCRAPKKNTPITRGAIPVLKVFQLINFASGDTWAVAVDGYSFNGTEQNQEAYKAYINYDAEAGTYTVLKDFTADLYIKLSMTAGDQLYVELK